MRTLCAGGVRQWRELNANVRRRLVYDFLIYAGAGMWASTMLSIYLQQLTGGAALVGAAEGTQGMCMAMAAIPAGILADRLGRERVLRYASAVGVVATLAMSAALWAQAWWGASEGQVYALMVAGLGCYGLFTGVSSPALDALLADSMATGARAGLLTLKQMNVYVASATGPLLNLLCFAWMGDAWDPLAVCAVMQAGMVVGAAGMSVIVCFDERDVLGAEAEAVGEGNGSNGDAGGAGAGVHGAGAGGAGEAAGEREDAWSVASTPSVTGGYGDAGTPLVSGGGEDASSASVTGGGCGEGRARERRWIPAIVVASDIVMALASGMTIKFFPLFFQVCVLDVA